MRRHATHLLLLIAACLVPLAGCGGSGEAPVEANIAGDAPATDGGSTPASANAQPQGDPLHPIVELHTSAGVITVELDGENAPGTVRNFLNYVNSAHYDGTLIHYIEPGAMILGGGFTSDLQPKPELAPIRNEAHNGLKNKAGTIAMSHPYGTLDSATCQFFINVRDNPQLDHQGEDPETYGYCVFGEVKSGLEVAEQISNVIVEEAGEFVNTPKEHVVIKAVRVVR